jgi:hypothetical protein
VQQREGRSRDGACEHGVLQQRAVGEAPLHEPAHVCLLMHVGAAQACTRLQERQLVLPAAHWGLFHPAHHVSTVPQVKYRVLGR